MKASAGILLVALLAVIVPAHAEDSRMAEARAAFDAALAIWDRSPSPMIDTLLRRALSLHEAAGGATDRTAARIRNRIGRNAYNGGAFEVAEEMFRDAVTLATGTPLPKDLEFAAFLGDLAAARRQLGRYTEAWDPVCRSLAIRRDTVGARDPLIAASLNNMGRIALGEGRPAEAYALLSDAYAINRDVFGEGSAEMRREADTLERVRRLAQGRRIDNDPCVSRATS